MLVDRIGLLVTNDPELGRGPLGTIRDAAVVVEGDRVAWAGPRSDTPGGVDGPRLDAAGRCVIPGFVDSHTHLVFAGHRAEEFAARLAGQPYEAGGIRTTVAATRAASDDALTQNVRQLAGEALRAGTTTLEVKSGYGLTVDDERRSLEAVHRAAAEDLPALHPTFLGAHVVPDEHAQDPDTYVGLVAGDMLAACAPLAEWCDVFCEEGAFDEDQARTVLEAGRRQGLGSRVHANQLRPGPGALLAADVGAASADHLTHLTDDDIAALVDAGVVATLLPAAEFSTRSAYAPARRLLEAGATVALATDCNPGTSYTTSMPFVIALACREYGMTVEEALVAATVGGARSLRRPGVGRITEGTAADLVALEADTYVHLAYRPAAPLAGVVVRAGRVVYSAPRGAQR